MDYHFQFHLNNITPPNSFLINPKPIKRNNMELEVEAQEQQTSAGFLSPKVLISLGTSTPPMFSNMPRSSEVPTTFFPSLYDQSPHQENSHTTTTTTASCHSNNNMTQLLGKRQEMEGGDDQEMGSCRESDDHDMKAKIVGHPQYSNLLDAYMDCQKVGAPKQVVDKLSAIRKDLEHKQERSSNFGSDSSINDPELDLFMGAFYDVLVRYRDELSRPLQEAMQFLRSIESQLNTLCEGSGSTFSLDDKLEDAASTEEGEEISGGSVGEAQTDIDPVDLGGADDDINLKRRLLKKYGGCLGSLRQELSKKKKKGKLPKDARQKLLSWWELHYKWPYPSEAEKMALAESTGLDQKQINNWFINQRKRHWKPSDDMQFVVLDHGNYHHQSHMHPHVAPHEAATAHTSSFYIDHHHRQFINGNSSFSFNP